MSADPLAALLAASARGDRSAFSRLYEASSAKLFGVALRIVRREDWAEEVLQECYVRIWERARDYRESLASPMTWMTSIVRNRCLDWLRRPHPEVADPEGERIADPSRVFLTGASNGGVMSMRAGCELGSRIAGIAPVVANLPVDWQCRAHGLPALLIHGTEDEFMPFAGGKVAGTKLHRNLGEVLSVEDTVAAFKRDHLLRSLVPLYLGRTAAFVMAAEARSAALTEALREGVSLAFERQKPLLAEGWR